MYALHVSLLYSIVLALTLPWNSIKGKPCLCCSKVPSSEYFISCPTFSLRETESRSVMHQFCTTLPHLTHLMQMQLLLGIVALHGFIACGLQMYLLHFLSGPQKALAGPFDHWTNKHCACHFRTHDAPSAVLLGVVKMYCFGLHILAGINAFQTADFDHTK